MIGKRLMWSVLISPGIKTHRSSASSCAFRIPTVPLHAVSAVREEINRRQNIRFRLVVQRTAVDIIGPAEIPNSATPETKQLLTPTRHQPPCPRQTEDPLLEVFKQSYRTGNTASVRGGRGGIITKIPTFGGSATEWSAWNGATWRSCMAR